MVQSAISLQGLDVNFNSLPSSFVKDYSGKQITRRLDKKGVGELFLWVFHLEGGRVSDSSTASASCLETGNGSTPTSVWTV